MSVLALLAMLAAAIGVLAMPRRAAMLAFLIGAAWIPIAEQIMLGPFNFYALRVLIAAALLRVFLRREWPPGGMNRLDFAFLVWGVIALATSVWHNDPAGALVNRMGLVFTNYGTYLAIRGLIWSIEDVERLCLACVWCVTPVAIAMVYELSIGYNVFSALGGVAEWSEVRDGKLRAQGPFAHSILAGTVGAVCLPLAAALWTRHRQACLIGCAACAAIVIASNSSGPLMCGLIALLGLVMWRARERMRAVRLLLLFGYIGLEIVMKAPAYYLIARIDLTGSSTSWHRAALIEAAFTHLGEWWLVGTDYTRHWMAYGVLWTPEHIDVTNYYLRMGVDGGLPLMLTFIATLAVGFALAGAARRAHEDDRTYRFLTWALGVSLLAHTAAFVSVSYFDQTVVFLALTLAAIGSTTAGEALDTVDRPATGSLDSPTRLARS